MQISGGTRRVGLGMEMMIMEEGCREGGRDGGGDRIQGTGRGDERKIEGERRRGGGECRSRETRRKEGQQEKEDRWRRGG